MLKKLILENWKSFRYAELPIDPLTVLVGTNASGKSNVLDALEFLRNLADGLSVEVALQGDESRKGIRGGKQWCSLRAHESFTLCLELQGQASNSDYLYRLCINSKELMIQSESLSSKQTDGESGEQKVRNIFSTEHECSNEPLEASAYGYKFTIDQPTHSSWNTDFSGFGGGSSVSSNYSFLPRLASGSEGLGEPLVACNEVWETLRQLFAFNPSPEKMRSYSPLTTKLNKDASNIAGLIAASPQKDSLESQLSSYLKELPENELEKIWSAPVGELSQDAMLYCQERWQKQDKPLVLDSRGMSDGTLHMIAIITSLLTLPTCSQLIIDEVDSCLHPSRARLLLRAIREIGEQRNVDVLVTTHNPALLDSLEQDYLPFIVVAHRDSNTGESLLTPLDKLENLPKLLASASLGDLVTQGAIERNLEAEAIAS